MAPRKKLSKKEKSKLDAELAEAVRVAQEKERQQRLERGRQRKLIEKELAEGQLKQEIEENRLRRLQLLESSNFFKKTNEEILQIHKYDQLEREWNRHMRCNNIPNAYDPRDIRKFIYKWQIEKKSLASTDFNWQLGINNRSILTQDKWIPNLTKANIQAHLPNIGDKYSMKISIILNILKELEASISEFDFLKTPIEQHHDLVSLKTSLRTIVIENINEMTFSTLSSVERDMNLADSFATFCYASPIFKIQLWTERQIPKPQLNPKEKQKLVKTPFEITFETIDGLNVSLPSCIDCKNMAIRGLWMSFDHLSDYCFSYAKPIVARLPSIRKHTKIEWKKRKQLLQDAINEINKELKRNIIIDDDEMELEIKLMNIDKIYAENEIKMDMGKRKEHNIVLKEFEVNLRKYRIVGGIYSVDIFNQPEQDRKINHYMYLRNIIHPETLQIRGYYHPYRPPIPVPACVARPPEDIEEEMRFVEKNLEKLISVSIQLNPNVLWIEPPIVCRWETPEETFNAESLYERKRKSNSDSEISLAKDNSGPKKIIDFDIHAIPPEINISWLIREILLPRLPHGYDIEFTRVNNNKRIELKNIHEGQRHSGPSPFFPRQTLNKIDIIKQNAAQSGAYMLSKFIEDLELLHRNQFPFIVQQAHEANETLSNSDSIDNNQTTNESNLDNRKVQCRSNSVISANKDGLTAVNSLPIVDQVIESDLNSDENSSSDDDAEEETFRRKSVISTNNVHGRWSVRDIHDVRFNEDKLVIQFRTGRLGIFGLASNRYCNIPFQTWEIKPDYKNNTIVFSLTAAVVSLEIQIKSDCFILSGFQGIQSDSIQAIIGKKLEFNELRDVLIQNAIDVFPDNDAFNYAEGCSEKHPVMETHLYTCMCSLALTYNFSWSRWNLLSGRRTAVLLMREIIENKKIPNPQTLFVTPLKATIINSTEVSSTFNTTVIEGMKYYADLYHLAIDHSDPVTMRCIQEINPRLRNNVLILLQSVRPLSFS